MELKFKAFRKLEEEQKGFFNLQELFAWKNLKVVREAELNNNRPAFQGLEAGLL